ncbi:Aquaporin Z [Microbacterium sp. TNHR37B]|nr:Aquaporin Z [Microbacterium sp. TNHR37B]
MLVAVVVGSGIAAQRLSPHDAGLQLLENSIATALGLGVLIVTLAPVSGGHLNPVVSLVDWALGRRWGTGLPPSEVVFYIGAQIVGGVAGTVLASVMFDVSPALSETPRSTPGQLVGEFVATAGLVVVIFTLARTATLPVTATAVGAYIGAAYWFTSSTSFANPAVTIARMFTDTFAGISPGSIVPFILAQLGGAAAGMVFTLVLHRTPARVAGSDARPPTTIPEEHS